ncbi:hypothetical protein A2U01_0119528, partial [Trifolium medium]|nr:hypothetical protein [Trifolium medium]
MIEIIFIGETSQAHLLVMDPRTRPISSTKMSFEESSEASFARHKGILE